MQYGWLIRLTPLCATLWSATSFVCATSWTGRTPPQPALNESGMSPAKLPPDDRAGQPLQEATHHLLRDPGAVTSRPAVVGAPKGPLSRRRRTAMTINPRIKDAIAGIIGKLHKFITQPRTIATHPHSPRGFTGAVPARGDSIRAWQPLAPIAPPPLPTVPRPYSILLNQPPLRLSLP